ncbi:MAG: hypothetical protein C0402_03055 [Thermodesulfovibrio sp.]|nr:hypothetical protein [Thermodesulfovibrio sp.]
MRRFSRHKSVRAVALHATRDLGNPQVGLTRRYLGILLAGNTKEESDNRKNKDRKNYVISHFKFYHTGAGEIPDRVVMFSAAAGNPAAQKYFFINLFTLVKAMLYTV